MIRTFEFKTNKKKLYIFFLKKKEDVFDVSRCVTNDPLDN